MIQLRDYQRALVDGVFDAWKSTHSTLAVLPTGAGKTICFAEVIRLVLAGGTGRCMVIAHREELIHQAVEKIARVSGERPQIEMGAQWVQEHSLWASKPKVVAASVQTLISGMDGAGRMSRFNPHEFCLVIIDEAHHATADSYRRVIAHFRQNENCLILGVTATPDRADEKALGLVFQSVGYDCELPHLIQGGWLCPIVQQFVTVQDLDFSECRTTAGDLNGADLARVMEEEKIIHGIVDPTVGIVGDKRTLAFAASVKQAERMAEVFNRYRPNSARFISGTTPDDVRRDIISQYRRGEFQFLCNCAIATEGFDVPGIQVVIPKATKSRSLFAQMVGRATRPLDGLVDRYETPGERRAAISGSEKPECLVLDFCGVSGRHKLITTADILGGDYDDDVIEAAAREARESGEPINMADALERAEREKLKHEREEEERRQRAKPRDGVKAKASYSSRRIDPFDVLDILPRRERGWDVEKELSPKMRSLLERQGIDPDGLSYARAGQLCGEIIRRFTSKECTFKQAKILRSRGYDTKGISAKDASKIIDEIAEKEGWAKRKTAV